MHAYIGVYWSLLEFIGVRWSISEFVGILINNSVQSMS
jgi:hypothetical protein